MGRRVFRKNWFPNQQAHFRPKLSPTNARYRVSKDLSFYPGFVAEEQKHDDWRLVATKNQYLAGRKKAVRKRY